MCFINDYKWSAEISEHSQLPAITARPCYECRMTIQPGEIVHYIYMQEHEECRNHDDQEAYGCDCEEPEYGETYDYERCDKCEKFLQAIEAAEVEEGCHRNEARPHLEGMIEELSAIGAHDCRRYFKKALRMFPELKEGGWLGQLWRMMF